LCVEDHGRIVPCAWQSGKAALPPVRPTLPRRGRVLMLACVLHAVGDLRCEERPQPIPQPGEALVRVAASGVCGSDLPRVFLKGTYTFPLIPGHEIAGVDESTGEPVAVNPFIAPPDDLYTRAGLPNLSEGYRYLGSRCDGGWAEYVTVPRGNLVPLPPGLDAEAAAFAEPCSVAIHALRRGGPRPGDCVCIIGTGPMGLILCQLARSAGAGTVLMVGRNPRKLAVARSLGAATVNSADRDPVAATRDMTGGVGADVVMEAVGAGESIATAFAVARKRGTVVLLGNPSGPISFTQGQYWEILRRELNLVGTWNSVQGASPKDEWVAALEALASGQVAVGGLISHRARLEDLPGLLSRLWRGDEEHLKALVRP